MSNSPTSTTVRVVAPGMRTTAVVLWAAAVALLVLGFVDRGESSVFLVPVPSVFVAVVAWVVLWRPRIELTPEALVVVDVRRTSIYAWPRVTGVRTKYGIEIQSTEADRRVWIAPRPTARLRLDVPGGQESVDVEAAAAVIRTRVPEQLRHEGPPPTMVTPQTIVHRAHGWAVLTMIVMGIAASLAAARL